MDRSLHPPCDQASTHSVDTAVLREDPVEIASGVCWVGVRLAHGPFQCHSCFLANGVASLLIDPGSPLTIVGTLAKLRVITDLDAIRWLVCHHGEPDICAALPLAGDRRLEFQLTPYLHFPGAMVSHDSSVLGRPPAGASRSAWG
ncbi:hypothetical protein [Cyanobium gracile]|uniref:hypothetical protein n=1 Tax=Cyanobium gracile TaxID=59930 RepID=UPI0005B8D4D4|nr:hypothetical protein [Cyanobium gracile]